MPHLVLSGAYKICRVRMQLVSKPFQASDEAYAHVLRQCRWIEYYVKRYERSWIAFFSALMKQ